MLPGFRPDGRVGALSSVGCAGTSSGCVGVLACCQIGVPGLARCAAAAFSEVLKASSDRAPPHAASPALARGLAAKNAPNLGSNGATIAGSTNAPGDGPFW